MPRLNQIHSKLDWQLRRNEKMLQEVIGRWFAFTVKQIQTDLRTKFQKDITSELSDWEYLKEQGQQMLKPATLDIMRTGGQQSYKLLSIRVAFDVLNVESVKAAEKFTAKLVTQVNNETKKGIRTYISAGIKDGKAMPKIARELRPLVGLTQNQTQSVMNYRNLLSDKEKFPRLSASDIDRKTTKYAGKTHRRRAQMIARTETARAQNIGYVMGMEELGIGQLEHSVHFDDRLCEICAPLDGKKYTISEGRDAIPVHPNCRCAVLPVIAGKAAHKPSNDLGMKQIKDLEDKLSRTTNVAEQLVIRQQLGKFGVPKPTSDVVPMKEKVKSQKDWEKSMTKNEIDAVDAWSSGAYQDIRFLELGGNVQELSGAKYHTQYLKEQLHNALNRAPNYKGIVYRGGGFHKLDVPIETAKKGQKFIFNTTSSFSKDMKLAETMAKPWKDQAFLLKVNAKTGVDISHAASFSGEQEVLSRKGTSYVVRKVTKLKDYTLVEVDEVVKLANTTLLP